MPELLVLLVKEDMEIHDMCARKILESQDRELVNDTQAALTYLLARLHEDLAMANLYPVEAVWIHLYGGITIAILIIPGRTHSVILQII